MASLEQTIDSRLTGIEEERIQASYARRRGDSRYTWFRPDYVFTVQRREQQVLNLLCRHGWTDQLPAKRILEVGCGNGAWLRDLIKWGARPENLTGIDLLPERIEEARRLCPSSLRLCQGSATELPAPDQHYDLVLQATVFTSILDTDLRRAVAAEMLRVLKPGGLILWYDFLVNNPRNADVRGVRKREIHQLFPGCQIRTERATLAPPVARAVVPVSWWAGLLLEKLPWLCTHCLATIRKS